MFAKKRGSHKGLIRGLVLLLSLVTLLTSLNLGGIAVVAESVDAPVIQHGGTAVDSIVLPQDEKRTLSTDEIADASYRWQICADSEQDLWVNIHRQRQSFITLSYAMVGSLLDRNGTVLVRCVVTKDGESRVSAPVRVAVSYSVKEFSEPQTAAPVLRAPRRAAPTEGELKSYTITVNFVYENGDLAYEPYVATIEAGGAFKDIVRFPDVVGYLPYFGLNTESTSSYTIDIASISADETYTVTYKPTEVRYTVHHMTQNILDDQYELHLTEEKTGLTGAPVGDNCAMDIDGFAMLYYDRDVQIAADGSTEIEIYYDRNYYLLSFDLDGGYGVDPIYARYGATLSVNKPTRPGYVFDGWELTECDGEDATAAEKNQYNLDTTITLPAMNLKYQAKWTTTDTTYTVVYWAENADDDGYSYLGSRIVENVTSASTVSGSNDYTWDEKQYFSYNAEKTDKDVLVEGDGSTVVNVYYTRNQYTLKFTDGTERVLTCGKEEHTHTYTGSYKVGGIFGIGGTTYYYGGCYPAGQNGSGGATKGNEICGKEEHSHRNSCYSNQPKVVATITAKYGADIHDQFPIKDGNDTIWWTVPNGCKSFKPGTQLGSIDRMPGENITFTKDDSESGADIYYYIEALEGQTGTYTHDGKNFILYKTINLSRGYGKYLTYSEEFHDIAGFTQWWSDPAFDKMEQGGKTNEINAKNYLCYTRNSYTLRFYNFNAEVTGKEESVQYQAPLSGKNFTPDYPTNLEPNAYEFAGWYTTAECFDGSEVDWDNATMPATDVKVYAKWAPKTHTVHVYRNGDMTDLLGTQTVPHGSIAKAPEEPQNGNYVFNGWFYLDENGEKKAFDFNNMPVNRDLNIFAEWSSKTPVLYTVRYELEDGTQIAEPTVGSALAGSSKTFSAKGGSELYAGYQERYFPNTNSHTIQMNINGDNEFTFIYVAKENVPYTVRYLEKDTNKVLADEKHVDKNKKSVITEIFKQISGYMPDAYQKRLVLSVNDEENVLTFWYTKDSEHAYYAVIHWVQNLEGDGYTEYRTIQSPGTIGQEISEAPLMLTGFTYNAGESNPKGSLTAEGLVLNLYYDRNEYRYTVKYLEYGTDTELAKEKTSEETYRYGKVVSETAIEIPGYTLVGDKTKSRTIRDGGNEIVFYYTEQEVTIKYVAVPAEGGTVSRGSETIKARTGKTQGSTPTAQPGYRFDGWYTDEACTNPVNSTWVDENQTITPQKNGEIYQPATYYAKFVKNNTDLTITKNGAEAIDENQTFLFRVKGTDENTTNIDLTVTIHGNSSVKITELPVGAYTVTELTDWSWRYEPTVNEKTITLAATGGNTLTFENSRDQQQWLGGDSYCVNNFNN